MKTPEEWQTILGIYIQDADGWHGTKAKDWFEPITEYEFLSRARRSTLQATHKGWAKLAGN